MAQAKEDMRQEESDDDATPASKKELLAQVKGLQIEMAAREEAEKKLRNQMVSEMEQIRDQLKQQFAKYVSMFSLCL